MNRSEETEKLLAIATQSLGGGERVKNMVEMVYGLGVMDGLIKHVDRLEELRRQDEVRPS